MQRAETSSEPVPGFNRDILQAWMQYMEDYGQTWLDDVGKDFFSQEYWYLFVITLVYHWRQAPLNISDACRSMKTGSSKTRENRLKKLLAEHWAIKVKDQADMRQTYLEPTEEMLLSGRKHFRKSLGKAVRFLADTRLLKGDPEPLIQNISGAIEDENMDKHYLLPWAEFLIDYTNDWNNTFKNRFHTEEYWNPFVYCLRGYWAGRPLTMSDACQCMRTGSNRTREKRIALAVSRGMLVKQKSANDLRTTLILATDALEGFLASHFSRTLNNILALTQRLLEEQGSSP